MELQYDRDLAGKPGSSIAERDTGGSAIAFSPQLFEAPVDGAAVTLTIDRYVQWVAERELAAAVRDHHARGGTVVILNPNDGALLAAASLPTLAPDDSNLYSPREVALYGIPAVSRAAEPGSIFNVFTVAAALASGSVTPDSAFNYVGSLTYVGTTITDTRSFAPGPMTVLQSLAFSSNVGVSWIGTTVGPYRYYQSLSSLQLGHPTGVDLPGEVGGLLRVPTDLDWSATDLAVNSFGQGVTVTPIQLATAVAALAHGGTPSTPYVMRRVGGPTSGRAIKPNGLPAAMKPAAASALTAMLQTIVDDDTTTEGRLARVAGYALAGKAGSAGTSDALSPGQQSSLATFIGYGPVERPRFAIVVQIDASTDGVPADEVTSPVFAAIARQLLSYYQIAPSRAVAGNGR